MKTRRSPSLKPAYSLMEMVFATALLGVFSLMTANLYMSTTLTATKAREAEAAVTRFDSIMAELRRDVWNAQSMRVEDGRALVLLRDGDSQVFWTSDRHGDALTRRASSVDGPTIEHQFVRVGADLSFAIDGPSLLVRVHEGPDKRGGQVRMVSQVMLHQEVGP